MDKKTISHYGWVIVVSLVIAVMLAFATPFGEYIGNGVVSIAQGMVGTNSEAVKEENVENLKDKFSGILNDCTHENTHLVGVKETTCEKDGYTGDLVCKDCLAVLEEGQKQKGTIHEYGTQVVKTPSTCSTQGIAEKTCINCGHIEKVYLETVAHSNFYETGAKAATCTVDGNTPNKLCGVCNAVVEYGQTIKSTGHNVVTTPAVAATCTKSGLTEGSHCSKCNEVIKKQTIIPKAAHAEINGGTADIHKKCKVCGVTTDTTHSYSMATLGTSTCTEGAIVRSSCNCGYYYDTQLPAKPHTEVATPAITATCTQKGLSAGKKCSVCNEIIIPQYETSINPDNHTGSIVNVGTKEIHTKYSCCNKVVSQYHSYTTITNVKATCTTEGNVTQKCSCGYQYTEITPASGSHELTPVKLNTQYTSHYECSNCDALIMPEGAIYYVETDYYNDGDYSGATKKLVGDGKSVEFPTESHENDVYVYNGYEYFYGDGWCDDGCWSKVCGCEYETAGWGVRYIGNDESPVQILENINGTNVTSTTFTFADNSTLTIAPEIPQYVTNCRGMFSECTSLTVAPIFPSNITDMSDVFYNCMSLVTYEGSTETNGYFDSYPLPTNLTRASYTFYNCDGIYSMNVLPNSISYMYAMFRDCSNLNNIYIPTNATNLSYTYYNCDSLEYCYLTDLSKIQNMSYTFANCDSFYSLDLSNSDASKNTLTNINHIAYNCPNLCYIYMQNVDGLKDMSYAFYNCTSLYEIYGTIPSSVTNMSYAFVNCALDYDYMGSYIQINANPTSYTNCFKGAQDIAYLTGESTMLAELAATDGYQDFSNLDKIRVVVDNPIPLNATYIKSNGTKEFGDDVTLTGDGVSVPFPDAPLKYDIYEQGEYRYTYKCFYDRYRIASELASEDEPELFRYDSNYGKYYHLNDDLYNTCDHNPKQENCAGWGMDLQWCMHHKDSSRTSITEVALSNINGISVNDARCAFYTFENLTVTPELPESLQCLQDTFAGCSSLTGIEKIPSNAVVIAGMFANCSSLNTSPELPSTVIDIHNTFRNCVSLVTAPTIPEGVHVVVTAFCGCTALTGPIEINMEESLDTCRWSGNMLENIFLSTTQPIYVWGTSPCLYDIVYNTSHNGNVHLLEMNGTIPTGGTYYVGVTGTAHGDFSGATTTYTAGQAFPMPKVNDVFVYDGYEYRYGKYYSGDAEGYKNSADEWSVKTLENDTNRSKTSFDDAPVLRTISGKRIQSMQYTYLRMDKLNDSTIYIPDTVLYMIGTFEKCTSLVNANDIKIPNGVLSTASMFWYCEKLVYADIEIPNTVTDTNRMFTGCFSLTTGPSVIPNSCYILDAMFQNCTALTGDIEMNCNKSSLSYSNMFAGTIQPIFIYGPCNYNILESIAATSTNNNVQVLTSKIIETSHNPYENNNDYIVLGTYNFPNANSVNITITYQTESTSYDWISITEGKNYVAGKSYTEQRKYLTSSGSITTTKGNSSTARIGGTTYTTKTFNNVNLKTGSIIFRTDGSVNSYYGAKVIITPNY